MTMDSKFYTIKCLNQIRLRLGPNSIRSLTKNNLES
jgi:hypothetical protein